MTDTNTDDTDVMGSQIHTVRISFDELKTALRASEEHLNRKSAVLRIYPSWGVFDVVETATFHWKSPSTLRPDGTPPIDINPGLLYGSEHPYKAPTPAQYPSRGDEGAKCRDEHGFDMEEEMGDVWNEWWDQALKVWESQLKGALRDEVDLYGDTGDPRSVAVEIEWTDLD
jgi:hypothetical protein